MLRFDFSTAALIFAYLLSTGAPARAADPASKKVCVDIPVSDDEPSPSLKKKDVSALKYCWLPPNNDRVVRYTIYYGPSSCSDKGSHPCVPHSPEANKAYPYHIDVPVSPSAESHDYRHDPIYGVLKKSQVIYSRITAWGRVRQPDGSVKLEETGFSQQACTPTTPQRAAAKVVSAGQVELSWEAATDPLGIWTYEVYRDGVKIGATAQTRYRDAGLKPNTRYTYNVRSLDAQTEQGIHDPSASALSAPISIDMPQ